MRQSKSKRKRKYYWDTTLWLEYLRPSGNFPPEVAAGLLEIGNQARRREVVIITSTVTLTEVLPGYEAPDVFERWQAITSATWVELRDVDDAVGWESARIRGEFFKNAPPEIRRLAPGDRFLADSIHAATVKLYADELTAAHILDARLRSVIQREVPSVLVEVPTQQQLDLTAALAVPAAPEASGESDPQELEAEEGELEVEEALMQVDEFEASAPPPDPPADI